MAAAVYERVTARSKVATIGHGVSRRPFAVQRQESFGSFTTEDCDVFHSSTLPKKVSPPMCRKVINFDWTGEGSTSSEAQVMRRRSKSVGAMTTRLKLGADSALPSVSVSEEMSCPSKEITPVTFTDTQALPPSCVHLSADSDSTCVHGPPVLPPRSPLPDRKRASSHVDDHHECVGTILPGLRKSEEKDSTMHFANAEHSTNDDHHPAAERKVSSRRLSRQETGKLCRKMSRRQKHELMMDSEFDEFDDLDVVVEGEFSDDDELAGKKNDRDSANSDTELEKRVAIKLNEDTLQVDEADVELKGAQMTKVQRIANELLCTEKNYVKKLHLIDQVFHFEVIVRNREHHYFPEDVVPQMFSNIKSIFQFHNDFLLPQLELRLATWSTIPRIGDVMKRFAPFLKLYTDYVKNFDHAMETINAWTERSSKFAALLDELQKLPECGHLTLQHHMLEPIQRVPRYQLLLRDYLKHLEADDVDRADTESALVLVSKAAIHSNEAMRKIERFRKLLDINESLGENIDLISPTRELVKEGKMMRVSERDGDQYERYMILFTDLLLVCHTLPVVIGNKQRYKIKSKIDIDGMEVCDGNNLELPNTFLVKGRQKSIELLASSAEEKLEWQLAIEDAIVDCTRKLLSRKANLQLFDVLNAQELGKRAPTWIKDQETSMCMRCTDGFTTFRRRHHCRACGIVVCNRCSMRKVRLEYNDNQETRVCDDCYKILQRKVADCETSSSGESQQPQTKKKGPGFLHVKASDPCIISGYLNLSSDRRTWQRRFFAVHKDFVLYSFKAHQDGVAMSSLPLPGYRVSVVGGVSGDGNDPQDKFRIYHRGEKKTWYFQADSRPVRNKWVEVLEKVVFMQLPEPVSLSPTTATVSFRDVARNLSNLPN